VISRPAQITIFLLLAGVLAGGIYMNQLKQREELREQSRAAAPLAPPNAGAIEDVELVIAYDEDGVLKKEAAHLALSNEPHARAKQVLQGLIAEYTQQPSPHPVAEGSAVKEVFITADGLCVVDLNAAFAEGHRSGVLVEEMTIASMVESLGLNVPSVKRVKFLVEGKDRETLAGHADLGMIYEVQTVHQLVAGLQAK
jgi:hypothetical protein